MECREGGDVGLQFHVEDGVYSPGNVGESVEDEWEQGESGGREVFK